ncbi:hypothetical protein K227x_48210 [Rubripirellula lacrimiformis]|uniref:Uncharacterized protein n=1 Tax=Rubripirellula lacrimiformis TaxID=1930273 RepID=A0A517NH01_9BACT|nr:hypothetical protein K227x_48210 [Rubripirellula lacrimiformis]
MHATQVTAGDRRWGKSRCGKFEFEFEFEFKLSNNCTV